MKSRNIIVGAFILLAIGFLFVRSQRDNTPELPKDVPTGDLSDAETSLEQTLGRTISDDAERLNLSDLTDSGFMAIATRSEEGGVVEFMVLADLDEPKTGTYQVFAGSSADSLKPLGELAAAKGGYLFQYKKAGILSDFSLVQVRLGDKNILQGTF